MFTAETKPDPAAVLKFYTMIGSNAASDATKAAEQAQATRRKAEHSKILSKPVIDKIGEIAGMASDAALVATNFSEQIRSCAGRGDETAACALPLALAAKKNEEIGSKNAAIVAQLANPNDPIDSISHSVNFVVTYGGSITPNWALYALHAPASSGNLASFSGIRTHTLTIALGSPATSENSETSRALSNAAFRQAIQSP